MIFSFRQAQHRSDHPLRPRAWLERRVFLRDEVKQRRDKAGPLWTRPGRTRTWKFGKSRNKMESAEFESSCLTYLIRATAKLCFRTLLASCVVAGTHLFTQAVTDCRNCSNECVLQEPEISTSRGLPVYLTISFSPHVASSAISTSSVAPDIVEGAKERGLKI